MMGLAETLRAVIEESGLPLLKLEQQTGVKRASIRRFLDHERTLRLDIADRLADYFGVRVLPPVKRRKGGK
jgi:plasmid maintenance system antidote protein VapI